MWRNKRRTRTLTAYGCALLASSKYLGGVQKILWSFLRVHVVSAATKAQYNCAINHNRPAEITTSGRYRVCSLDSDWIVGYLHRTLYTTFYIEFDSGYFGHIE